MNVSFLRLTLFLLVILTLVISSACVVDSQTGSTINQTYNVRVEDKATNKGIQNARVIVEVSGIGKTSDITDADGYARLPIPEECVGKPGRLIIEADGYLAYRSEINLDVEHLAVRILLESIQETSPLIPSPAIESTSPTPLSSSIPDVTYPNVTDDYGIKMVLIDAGSFQMGGDLNSAVSECQKLCLSISCDCSAPMFGSETPGHEVTLDTFYIDVYEVTNKHYASCVKDGACQLPSTYSSSTRGSYYGNPQFADYPVIYVDWAQAQAYCQWRGGSLPTEAQWEKAARGTDGRLYPWGNLFSGKMANVCDRNCGASMRNSNYDDGYADTAPVGSYPEGKSVYGVFDMAGNVLEWVLDWYSSTFYQHSLTTNPLGPDSGLYRSIRGGSWYHSPDSARTSNRFRETPDLALYNLGFRCVRSP